MHSDLMGEDVGYQRGPWVEFPRVCKFLFLNKKKPTIKKRKRKRKIKDKR